MQVHWSQTENYYLTQILNFDLKFQKCFMQYKKYFVRNFDNKLSREKKKHSRLRVFRAEFCTQKLNFAYKKEFFEIVCMSTQFVLRLKNKTIGSCF